MASVTDEVADIARELRTAASWTSGPKEAKLKQLATRVEALVKADADELVETVQDAVKPDAPKPGTPTVVTKPPVAPEKPAEAPDPTAAGTTV